MWEPIPHRPVADWLGTKNKASATRRRQRTTPRLEIPPYIYNFNTDFPRVDTVPHGVETPTPLALLLRGSGNFEVPPQMRTKQNAPLVDTAQHGVETPTPLAPSLIG